MLYEARGLTLPPPTLVCVAAPQGRCLVPAGRGASMLPPRVREYTFGRDRGASPAGLRMCDIAASLGSEFEVCEFVFWFACFVCSAWSLSFCSASFVE